MPLMVVALLTMVVGILGAVAQADIKRLLSFTLVSHIGYMIFGIAHRHGGRARRDDLLHHAPHHRADHPVPRDRARRAAGRDHVDQPARRHAEGRRRSSPCCSSSRRVNLGGIPPFSGFLGKVGLFEARRAAGHRAGVRAHRRRRARPRCSPCTPSPGSGTWRSGGRAPTWPGYSSPLLDLARARTPTTRARRPAEARPALMVTATTGMVALTRRPHASSPGRCSTSPAAPPRTSTPTPRTSTPSSPGGSNERARNRTAASARAARSCC